MNSEEQLRYDTYKNQIFYEIEALEKEREAYESSASWGNLTQAQLQIERTRIGAAISAKEEELETLHMRIAGPRQLHPNLSSAEELSKLKNELEALSRAIGNRDMTRSDRAQLLRQRLDLLKNIRFVYERERAELNQILAQDIALENGSLASQRSSRNVKPLTLLRRTQIERRLKSALPRALNSLRDRIKAARADIRKVSSKQSQSTAADENGFVDDGDSDDDYDYLQNTLNPLA